jgi:hypothetical protein
VNRCPKASMRTGDDVNDLDMIGCFRELVEGITRELCNLSLRTRSNGIILDFPGRTNFGGVVGKLVPADPEAKYNWTHTICKVPTRLKRMRYRKYQANQALLLEMPFALPRSFLTSSSGTFMK